MRWLFHIVKRTARFFLLPAMLAAMIVPAGRLHELSVPADGEYAPASLSSPIQHVFLVMMENKGYGQVWNTSSTPYITSLGKTYSRATAYHAVTHPSLPNYIDLMAGSNLGITTDCNPSTSCTTGVKPNMLYNLLVRGYSAKAYVESMPSPCYLTGSGNYAPKHNPFVYFDFIRLNPSGCNAVDVPFSHLATDLASGSATPNLAFISPNLCNDMHSCSIGTGDKWLENHIPTILKSPACTSQRCLVIIVWDEDNGNYGNRVLTIFAGSAARTGGVTSSRSYNHYSLLRTIEYVFSLPTCTSHDANASPMTDLLK